MDPDLVALVPVFVEEARERLERLAACLPRLSSDAAAQAEAKRELHTLKGAGRMLQLAAIAELAHAAEDLLHADDAPGTIKVPLLTRAGDSLFAMVESIATGVEPVADADLLGQLRQAAAPESEPATVAAPGFAGAQVADPVPADTATPDRPAERRAPGVGEVPADALALDAIAERATQVRIMALAARRSIDRMYELAMLAEDGLREPQPGQVLAVLATMLRKVALEIEGTQRRIARAAEEQSETMLSLQLRPLRGTLQTLGRYARDLGRSLGREIEVTLEGEDTRLDRRIVRELEETLLHLVRNAVDHGIESPAERVAAGKSPVGHLLLRAGAADSRVRLLIRDDGAGIAPERVVAQAVAAGLVGRATAASLTGTEALRLLFTPGFSTRGDISEISGRGVGLDIVAAAVRRVGGEVTLEAEAGRGTAVSVEVPLARRGEEITLLRVGDLRLAIPASAVRRASRLEPSAVIERDGRLLASRGDRLIPFVPLARLYGQPSSARPMLLEGQVSGQSFAVAVDEVEETQEVLVRPLPRAAGTGRLLEGIALLASGEPVAVLSPLALAQPEQVRAAPAVAPAPSRHRTRVLLVDDSRVTREMERRLLEDAGFEVVAVGNAQEALMSLGEASFDCVVTDVEMPGMDGVELTAQLRTLPHHAQLPIVIVSTRERPEDRLRGLKAGADAYLTKQSLNAGELIDVVRRLSGRM